MRFGHLGDQPARQRSSRRTLRALRSFAVCAIPAALAAVFLSLRGLAFSTAERAAHRQCIRGDDHAAPRFQAQSCERNLRDRPLRQQRRRRAALTCQRVCEGRYAVVGRLSIPGGDPGEDDAAATVRSLALRMTLPRGEEWRLAMNSTPVFPVRTPRGVARAVASGCARSAHGPPRSGEDAGVPRQSSRGTRVQAFYRAASAVVGLRQCHVLRHQRVPDYRRARYSSLRSVGSGAGQALSCRRCRRSARPGFSVLRSVEKVCARGRCAGICL